MLISKIKESLLINWFDVQYLSLRTAIVTGFLIVLILILKIAWRFFRRKRISRAHSGSEVKKYRENWVFRILYFSPRVAFALAVIFQLLALAEPYETNVDLQTISLETREVLYLVDGSGSMVDALGYTGKSKAEIAREGLLKFLRLRKDQKELSCLWFFSNNAYRNQGCTIDSYAFRFKVFMSPLVLRIEGEGGTNLKEGLEELISYLDYKNKPEKGKKSTPPKRILLMVTDGEITVYPAEEFEILKARRIVPYLLWIKNPSSSGPSSETLKLVNAVPNYGGRVFEIGEEESLAQAFREIHTREKSKIETKKYSWNVSLFQKALLISFVFILIALVLQFILELPLGSRIN